jgi:exodeoxyribonuclease-3
MLRILSFNIEYGAQEYPLDEALAVIRRSKADVVAVAEAKTEAGVDSARDLAAKLGWHHAFIAANASAVISRWPLRVVDAETGAVKVQPPDIPSFILISAHLTDFPYQPFQAKGIPYCYGRCQRPITSPEGIARAAARARGAAAERLAETATRLARKRPVVIAGDFNEPSHLDWTERAVKAGLCPSEVVFPVSRRLQKAGLVDAFRSAQPDEVAEPGHTWPAHDPGYAHRADRIDFIYATEGLQVISCSVLSSPSDHHAVLAEVQLRPALSAAKTVKTTKIARTSGGGASSRGVTLAVIIVIAIIVVVCAFVSWLAKRHGDRSRVFRTRTRGRLSHSQSVASVRNVYPGGSKGVTGLDRPSDSARFMSSYE